MKARLRVCALALIVAARLSMSAMVSFCSPIFSIVAASCARQPSIASAISSRMLTGISSVRDVPDSSAPASSTRDASAVSRRASAASVRRARRRAVRAMSWAESSASFERTE